MGEILGIGCSHGPGIMGRLDAGAHYLRQHLGEDETPADLKDPKNWPTQMQEEWADDEGIAFAARYQEILQPAYRAARKAIDDFRPDFVVVFGDDQYEVFKEDCLPPFCVFAIDEVKGPARTGPKAGEPVRVLGHQEAGNYLARELILSGFEVATSWRLHLQPNYGHAFLFTRDYLELTGEEFTHRVVPISVNCYGRDLRVPNEKYPNPAQIGRLMEDVAVPPPPSPRPWRCYDLGKRVAEIIQASPWRAAIIGSSSWSHASLTAKHHYLWPDVDADRQRLEELKAGEQWKWRDLDPAQIRDSGQHEILNWICLAGAMEGRKADVLAWAETYTINSSKCVALFPPA